MSTNASWCGVGFVLEITTVTGTSGNLLNIKPLKKGFNGSGRTVCVIKVPQYATATVTGDVTTQRWSNDNPDICGGVLVMAAQTLKINTDKRIKVNGDGYRGDSENSGYSWPGAGCKHPYSSSGCHGGTYHGCQAANGGGGGGIWSTPA